MTHLLLVPLLAATPPARATDPGFEPGGGAGP